jgi:hypothetical protein
MEVDNRLLASRITETFRGIATGYAFDLAEGSDAATTRTR